MQIESHRRRSRTLALSALIWIAGLTAAGARPNEPTIEPSTLKRIAPGVSVIPDPRIDNVPNVGIIEGRKAVLVIDTGLGPRNGREVYDAAKAIARGRRIYLTTTHFHPEHSFGASAFPNQDYIANEAQAGELQDKGAEFLTRFRGLSAGAARALEDTVIVQPGATYKASKTLDLGGTLVQLREMPAHTRGDQIIYAPKAGVLFAGDLVEERFFPVMPDAESRGAGWIQEIDRMLALRPKVVVPGHGAIGDARLLRNARGFLQLMQTEVAERARRGESQAVVTTELKARYVTLHPDWGNAKFLPLAIAIFYGEALKQPPRLPNRADLD